MYSYGKKSMTYRIDTPSSKLDIKDIRIHNTLPWNKNYLSKNPSIRMKDVLELDLPNAIGKWDYSSLSRVLPMEDIYNNRLYQWSKLMILENEKFEMWIIDVDLPNAIDKWNWEYISRKATLETVSLYPHYRWIKSILGLSSNFDIRMVYINMANALDQWNWKLISQVVSMDIVLKHRELPWNRSYMGDFNDKFYIEMIEVDLPNATEEWGMGIVSMRPKLESILKYPLLQWDRYLMTYYRSPIDMRILDLELPNARGNWDWKTISYITDMEYVRTHPDKQWYRDQLCFNNRLTPDIIELDMPNAKGKWDWYYISSNAKYEDVANYPNMPWNRYRLGHSKSIRDNIVKILTLDLPNATNDWDKTILGVSLTIHDLVMYPNIPIEYFNDVIIEALELKDTHKLDWKNISAIVPMNMIIKYPFLPWVREVIESRKDLDYRVLGLDMPRAPDRWFWKHITHKIPYIDILRYPEIICKLGIGDIMHRNMSINSILALEFYNSKSIRDKKIMTLKHAYHDITFQYN